MKFFQKLGKSLMIPVSALPICGILMGLGYLLCPNAIQGGDISGFLPMVGLVLVKAGSAIIDNISWLFVIGVSMGMSDDSSVESALAGLVSWLMIITLLNPKTILAVAPSVVSNANYMMAFEKIQNTFIAMLAGIVGAFCYNRFKNVELPKYLSFFSGRRFTIIVSALASILVSLLLSIIWPLAFTGLVWVGKGIQASGGIGVGIHAFLNRLLIPLGLHHALNNVFWFDTIGIGDLTAYWAGKTAAETGWSVGMYMSGFFAPTMFGIAGAACAMIRSAKNKNAARNVLIASAVCAFLSGVTEPFEFGFMFLSIPLYVVYCVLYGIFAALAYYTGFRAGFAFSAGLTDLLFSASLPAAAKTWLILPLGAAAFIVFYFVFYFLIRKYDVKTPGREDVPEGIISANAALQTSDAAAGNISPEKSSSASHGNAGSAPNKYAETAGCLIRAMGGRSNIESVTCCATRLRTELKDTSLVDQNAAKAAGAIACMILDKTSCQIIIGTTVQQVCDEINRQLKEAPEPEEQASQGQPSKASASEEQTPEKRNSKAPDPCRAERMSAAQTVSSTSAAEIQIPVTGCGVAVGAVHFTDNAKGELQETDKENPPFDGVHPQELLSRFEGALEKVKDQFSEITDGTQKEIMESYILFLEDTDLHEAIRKRILSGNDIHEAIRTSVAETTEKLKAIDDAYIRSRADDVEAAYHYVLDEITGCQESAITAPVILFGQKLMPTDLIGIDPELIRGLITREGSATSHLAILARGSGTPYVCDASLDFSAFTEGEIIIIDTDTGRLIREPDEDLLAEANKKMQKRIEENSCSEEDLRDVTLPVSIFANIAKPADVPEALKYHAEGIGLFRSEFLFLNRDSAPDEEEQFAAYKSVVEQMQGKPVIIRTSDIGTDKTAPYMHLPHEENPALGRRAIRISLTEPEAFRVQLRALLRAACFGEEEIMYPMITSVKEIEMIQEQVQLAAKELDEKKIPYRIPKQGIMIETPAAAVISDELAKHVDFFSIGTNDLTQYTLALDRQGSGLDLFYDPHHKGIFRLIAAVAENAHKAGITVGICGELGADPEAIPQLIAAGIDELSMSAALMPKARKCIAALPAETLHAAALRKTDLPLPEDSTGPTVPCQSALRGLSAPADGLLIPMEDIPDPAFSSGALGQCFAVDPEIGNVYAPCSGTVASVAPTLHAITLHAENGDDVLIHVGIDTVQMNGAGFTCHVREGQKVSEDELLLTVDIEAVKKAGYSPMVIVALPGK